SDDPNWVTVLGWQGGLQNERGIFNDSLEQVGPGHFRSTQPMPASPARKIGTAVKVLPSCTRSSVFQVPETGIG
ncbi:hypothetical protein C6A85_04015, partial [Mycobacterium sp. ITM-2017-0098]